MEKLKVNFGIQADEKLTQEMLNAYNKCLPAVRYCQELGIPKEKIERYIATIYDFVCDVNYCRQCPGVKNCKKVNPLLTSKVTYKDGIVSNQLSPCKKLLERVSFESQFKIQDFPNEWLDTSLRDDLDETKQRKDALKKFLSFLKGETNEWIYLNGGVGSGKSFLAASMAIEAAKKNLGPVAFINTSQRIRELNDLSFKKNSDDFQKQLDFYCNIPILVLDDFGNEYKTDFVRDAIVHQLIAIRSNKKLFTIITSDFSIDEIEVLYSTSKAGAIRAKQIAKNLKNICKNEINLGDLQIY